MQHPAAHLVLAVTVSLGCSSSSTGDGAADAADTDDPGYGCCLCTERPRNADCGTTLPDTHVDTTVRDDGADAVDSSGGDTSDASADTGVDAETDVVDTP